MVGILLSGSFTVFLCFELILGCVNSKIQGSRELDQLTTCSSPVHLHMLLFLPLIPIKCFFPEGLYFKLCYKANAQFPSTHVICTGLQL